MAGKLNLQILQYPEGISPSGSVIEKVIYVSPEFVRVKNASGTYNYTYVYHEGSLVAQVSPGNKTFYMLNDNKGSLTVVTNSSGQVVENTSYSPYGSILSGGSKTRYQYEAKEYDSVLGSNDFHFRMQGIAGTPLFGHGRNAGSL